jgi:dihydropteroate synthase
MGICNVTPDSFSDGDDHFSLVAAKAHVDALVSEGADIVDVGGESTKPGAPRVSAKEQIARVLEVVRYASTKTCVSIDTTDAEVAAACIEAGAMAINDVSCLRDDELARIAAKKDAALILSHARGDQAQMRGFSDHPEAAYADVVQGVIDDLLQAANRAIELGVSRDALIMDPGLGFTKNGRQSAELLARTSDLVQAIDHPILIGASRKSFLNLADADANPSDRLGASIAAAIHAARNGASILRVHDVRATRQAIAMNAILSDKGGA